MSSKNDVYAILEHMNLTKTELSQRKARYRAKKSLLRQKGFSEKEATIAARYTLHQDFSGALPKPPKGSGVEVRGSEYPLTGQYKQHWSFCIWDTTQKDDDGRVGKRRRIRFEEIPSSITDLFPDGLEETIELKQKIEGRMGGFKARLEKQAEWINEHREHERLVRDFIKHETTPKKGKRVHQNGTEKSALYHYILPYFLKEQVVLDVREWCYYYDDFREWLALRKPLRNNAIGKTLSLNTQKNYIKVLNKYVEFVYRKGKFMGKPHKCQNYSKAETPRRGIESIIGREEERHYFNSIKEQSFPAAAFMPISNHTATRPSELLGVSVFDVKVGELPDDDERYPHLKTVKKGLSELIRENNFKVFGYIILKSQATFPNIRAKDGTIPRAALKNRREVSPRFYRFIPIVSQEVWQIIGELVNRQKKLYQKRYWGDKLENYLLFDGLTLSKLEDYYRRFRAGTKWEKFRHSPHCGRHTGCTEWCSLFGGNLSLASIILGHIDPKETEYYSHLGTLMGEEMDRLQATRDGESFFEQFNT